MRCARFSYKPFGVQIEAHRAPETHVLYAGGWGAGKTKWQIGEAIRNTAMMPGVPGLLCSPTFPIQRKTLYKTILETLPRSDPGRPNRWPRGRDRPRSVLGPAVRDWSSMDRVLTMWNGTQWFFGSLDDPGSIEGGEYGWGVLDEARLVSHEGWRIFNSRIRHPDSRFHRRSIGSVPAMGWMFDEFGRGVAGRRVFRASTTSNPYLPDGYAESLNLRGRRALAFLEGQWVHLDGTVYEGYNPFDGSVIPFPPQPGLVSIGFLDFGRRRPYAGVLQHDPLRDADVVVEEEVACDVLEAVHARRFAQRVKAAGLVLTDCWCDPAGDTANPQTGIPSVQIYERELREAGVLIGQMLWSTVPIERYIPNRNDAVEARFHGADGRRRLLVAEHLTTPERCDGYGDAVGIHRALLGYRYPKDRPGSRKPVKDGVHDHPCDALEYAIVGLYGVMERPDIAAMNAQADEAAATFSGEDYASW